MYSPKEVNLDITAESAIWNTEDHQLEVNWEEGHPGENAKMSTCSFFLFFFCINFIKSLHLPQEHSAHRGGSRTLKITLKTHNTQQTENK